MAKNIFITFHYTTHGIAYLKHILSAFYAKKCKVEDDFIKVENISQIEMNDVFENNKKGFLFDEIYYLTAPQEVFDRISSRRFNYRHLIISDEKVLEQGTKEIWQEINNRKFDNIEAEIDFVNKNYPNKDKLFMSQIWRDIQHYSIKDQILWLKKYSNLPKKVIKHFHEVELPIEDLRDAKNIAVHLVKFIEELKKKHIDAKWVINIALGSNETQVVWQVLAQNDFLPSNSILIRTYDNKASKADFRFKEFDIIEVSKKIISEIMKDLKVFDKSLSKSRIVAEVKMQNYIKSGFTVLLLGERGIGKTRLAEKFQIQSQNFVSVNCASFTDNLLAESILFGYKKGAFTDAKEDREGVFEQAKNGILFLDEIHFLSKLTQSKLMKAIETDSDNNFTIKRIGDSEEKKLKTTLIFASNKTIEELRELLLPDFYDRITQLVIEIPPLRQSKKDLENDFRAIWSQMRFDELFSYQEFVEVDINLLNWIKTLQLYGNYRDLQKIAIYYKTFLSFDNISKSLIKEKTAFEFTKNQFEKYVSFNPQNLDNLIDLEKNPNELVNNFKKKIVDKLIEQYGNIKNAVKFLTSKGYEITERTLFNWKK